MKIKKHVRIEKVIIPRSEILVTDQIESIMLEVMKFTNLKQRTHSDEIKNQLGFTKLINEAIINRLKNKFLIKLRNNSIELSRLGKDYLNQEKIFEEKLIDLRLIVTDDPHFVLRHSFYQFNENYQVSEISSELIEKRKLISGLMKSITKIGKEVFCFDVQDGLIEIESNSDLSIISTHIWNSTMVVKSKTDNYRYRIEINPNDQELNHELKRLSDLLDTNRIETLNQLFDNIKVMNNFQFQIDEKPDNVYELRLNSRSNISVANLIKFSNWLHESTYNRSNITWVIELSIFKSWFVDIQISIQSNNIRVLHLLFVHYLMNLSLNKLMDHNDFRIVIESEWKEFVGDKSIDEKVQVDHKLLFSLLWQFPEQQAMSKLIAAKLIEEEILN